MKKIEVYCSYTSEEYKFRESDAPYAMEISIDTYNELLKDFPCDECVTRERILSALAAKQKELMRPFLEQIREKIKQLRAELSALEKLGDGEV